MWAITTATDSGILTKHRSGEIAVAPSGESDSPRRKVGKVGPLATLRHQPSSSKVIINELRFIVVKILSVSCTKWANSETSFGAHLNVAT